MWLRGGEHTVLVSPQGGSILLWQYKDYTILGPPRIVTVADELKKRGETHWCYPNFGYPPTHKLHPGKHGWLRNRVMKINPAEDEKGDRAVFEYLGGFDESLIRTKVQTDPSGVLMTLEVEAQARTAILPGLHPYFAVPKSGFDVEIGEEQFFPSQLGGEALIHPIRRRVVRVNLGGIGTVQMNMTTNFDHLVLWSDRPREYVCVEPVCGTPGTYASEGGTYLEADQKFRGEVAFQFVPCEG